MDDRLDALGDLEGWHVEGTGARVHYRGDGDQYSVEYYAPNDRVLYWAVPDGDETDTAIPVERSTVPPPLRERVRSDLDDAGVDPSAERRAL